MGPAESTQFSACGGWSGPVVAESFWAASSCDSGYEIGESGGGLGLDVALSGGGEESGEGGVEVAGGEDIGVEKLTDLATGLVCSDALAVLWSVKRQRAMSSGV